MVPTHKETLVDEVEHGYRLDGYVLGSLHPGLQPGAAEPDALRLLRAFLWLRHVL